LGEGPSEAVAVGVEVAEELELGGAGWEGGVEGVVADVKSSEFWEFENGELEAAAEVISAEVKVVQGGKVADLG